MPRSFAEPCNSYHLGRRKLDVGFDASPSPAYTENSVMHLTTTEVPLGNTCTRCPTGPDNPMTLKFQAHLLQSDSDGTTEFDPALAAGNCNIPWSRPAVCEAIMPPMTDEAKQTTRKLFRESIVKPHPILVGSVDASIMWCKCPERSASTDGGSPSDNDTKNYEIILRNEVRSRNSVASY